MTSNTLEPFHSVKIEGRNEILITGNGLYGLYSIDLNTDKVTYLNKGLPQGIKYSYDLVKTKNGRLCDKYGRRTL